MATGPAGRDGDVAAEPLAPDSGYRPSRRGLGLRTAGGAWPSPRPRRRATRPRPGIVVAVFAGGFLGGLARYLLSVGWPAPEAGVPWAVFTINTTGAFLLALLLVLVSEIWPPTTYVRPALGTGFLGAFTTFSTLVVGVDQLATNGHLGTAVGYLLISTFAGLSAASFGLVVGRAVATRQRSTRQTGREP